MTGWSAQRGPGRSGRAVIVMSLLALLLVTAVPVALLAGLILMVLGHVVGGFALFGGSVLAAVVAVALAGLSGVRHLRKLVSGLRTGPLDDSLFTGITEPERRDYDNVVSLDRSEYTEVR